MPFLDAIYNDTPPVCHGMVHIDILSETARQQHKIRKKKKTLFFVSKLKTVFMDSKVQKAPK